MDRQIVWPGQIPLETDLLNTNRNTLVALGKLAGAIFGSNTYVNGLSVGANSPAALNVVVQPGEIYSLQNIDGTPYSSLAADLTHQIVKQGILLDAVTLSTPAPGSAGQSINYLIQATFSEVDGGATVLPYYNSSNPSQAYSGPSNSGSTSYTKRQGTVVLSAKAGVAATTGSQATPAPDSGYVGLAVVTVANGAASVTGSNIITYASAPYFGNAALLGKANTFTQPQSGPTPATGDRSTLFATTASFANEFVASKAASGYQKLPSGLIIQWLATGSISAGSHIDTPWPTTFPNGVLFAMANVIGISDSPGPFVVAAGNIAAGSTTASSARVFNHCSNTVGNAWVLGIGY